MVFDEIRKTERTKTHTTLYSSRSHAFDVFSTRVMCANFYGQNSNIPNESVHTSHVLRALSTCVLFSSRRFFFFRFSPVRFRHDRHASERPLSSPFFVVNTYVGVLANVVSAYRQNGRRILNADARNERPLRSRSPSRRSKTYAYSITPLHPLQIRPTRLVPFHRRTALVINVRA